MSRRGENIYKRKDNRWEARYIKGHRPDGKILYGYCYGKTYSETKQKVNLAKVSMVSDRCKPEADEQTALAKYCDEWLCLNRTKVKESTYVKYSNILLKHIKPFLGEYFIRQLSTVVIEEFSHNLLNEKKLESKTVRDILTVLKSILKYVNKQVPINLSRIEIVYPKDNKKEMRVLSRDEQTNLIEYLLKDFDKCKFGVLLALMTGMRIGEVCALRWADISLEDRVIKVSSTMQRLKYTHDNDLCKTRVVISSPKSSNAVRIIPMTDQVANLCKSYVHTNPKAFVLTGHETEYIEPRIMQYRLKKYTKECGIEGVHFHTLRHTFATRCVEVDFEIKSLSEILGHSSPRITLERYVHSSIELKRDNMKKLSKFGY